MMSSTTALKPRHPSSHLMAAVAAGIATEMHDDPGNVPASILEKAKGWSAPAPTGIFLLGHEAHEAGWRHGRLPGLRDLLGPGHPVFERMMQLARRYEGAVGPNRASALQRPTNQADLWQAAIYRWSYWFGIDCDLRQVYRDGARRVASDPNYSGVAYDADHAPDELLRQVLDVTLIDWIILLEKLRVEWPAIFEAVWSRNAAVVEQLSRQSDRLPDMCFLRSIKVCAERLRAVIGIFWEAERLFELLHAIAGPHRITMTKLDAALSCTTILGGAVNADSPTGRYVGSMWCHRGALALLFQDGPASGHDPRHPHRSLGVEGDPEVTDEIAGCATSTALEIARFNAHSAPPFVRDSRLRDIRSEEPVVYFAGRDARALVVRFLLEIRGWLGMSKGRKANQPPALFKMKPDSAIGRLALLIIARICPDTAWAIMREAFEAKIRKSGGGHPNTTDQLKDVVANPRCWRSIHGNIAPIGSVAARSDWLGSDILAGMVDKARDDTSQFVNPDLTALGHTVCFLPVAWFEPSRETAMLKTAWENVGAAHEVAFPGCFDRTIPADELAFCLKVAARQQVAATDMLLNPHCRQPDCVRAPVLTDKTGKPGPIKKRPTASQQRLRPRQSQTAKGDALNPRIQLR